MQTKPVNVPYLSLSGCWKRQERLRAVLAEVGLDAALITSRRHVHYFSGYWTRSILPSALLIQAQGETVISVANSVTEELAADAIETYSSSYFGTLVDDLPSAALQALAPRMSGIKRIGFDRSPPFCMVQNHQWNDLNLALRRLRRCKDGDEVALIRHAIAGCEAAYSRAREVIQPGVTEIAVYAAMLAAATETVGEPIGEMGNDFQSGTPGGPPRARPMEAGELVPLDVSIVVRGYSCDLCRTFSVDGQPTFQQRQAHEKVAAMLEHVEYSARAGMSCRQLYQDIFARLDGVNGWRFPHHLGHGIGLSPHEAPRLNPHWDDTLEVGDVFTVEPGLYGEELKAGIRIEQNYLVAESGLERLSHFPIEL